MCLKCCIVFCSEPSTKSADRVHEIQDRLVFFKPISTPKRDASTIAECVKLLKQHAEDIADLPKGLVTALRVLQWLSVEEELFPEYVESVAPVELKYRFAQVEMFSADVMTHFVKIIQVRDALNEKQYFY